MSISARPWRNVALATAFFIAATPAFASVPAFAAGVTQDVAPAAISGDDWSITEVPGGYEVTKTLAEPVEIRSDYPTLWADGVELGMATTSLDGLTLTVTTDDDSVLSATSVSQGWSGAGDPAADDSAADRSGAASRQVNSLAAPAVAPVLDADPTASGPYAVERDDYNLGDEAVEIRDFNRKGEIRAAVFMPVGATGERPVVVFLHGRHSSCSGAIPAGAVARAWPCYPADPATGYRGQVDIESYLGYNDAATMLASQGYAVVSISANAINALDGSLADDTGAAARAQLVMDHLSLLRQANAGTAAGLSASLTGRLDLDNVGLMGHSRGGEGVMRAALLNAEQAEPFGIKSVLPLAPTDYTRMTVPGVTTAAVLPYCDGDVEDQMGQKYIDDTRHAYDDDVLRSSALIMGTNHNYFNTVWTPGKYPVGTSDDWAIMDRNQTDPTCGASAPTRLNADEQYAAGNAYMAGFFRLTLGGEQQFLPMFDGSDAKPASAGRADVRVSATLPASTRVDITNFDTTDTTIQAVGAGTYATCESMSPLEVPATLPYCVTKLGFAQAPDYGFLSAPFGNGRATSVPSTPSMHFTYTAPAGTAAAGELRVVVPDAAADFSAHKSLSFRVSPDDSIPVGGNTDLTVTVVDGAGGSASVTASQFGDALTVLPGSTDPLRKVLLQQIAVPVESFVGADLSDIRQVRFTAPRAAGGVLLSDLTLQDAATIGTPELSTRPVASIPDVTIEEGAGIGSVDLPVVLSRAAEEAASVYVSTIGVRAASQVLPAMQKVDFAPGEQCKVISVPVQGDSAASRSATTSFITNVTNTQQGVTIGDSFGKIIVREDDGVVTSAGLPADSVPPVGIQGDACAEALSGTGALTVTPAAAVPGTPVVVSGAGFRAGEAVDFVFHSEPVALGQLVSVDGTVTFETVVPADAEFGAHEYTATGYGSARALAAPFEVLDPDAPVTPTDPGTDPEAPGTDPGAGAPGTGAGGGTSVPAGSVSAGDAASGNLAATGLQVTGWALAASVLLAGGILFVMYRRRSRAESRD